MASAFAPQPRTTTTSSGGGFVAPVRRVVTVAAPRAVTSSGAISVVPRREYITHYDPSRVVDLDNLKVVTDMRQSGSERGETQAGDDTIHSPAEARNGAIAAPGGVPGAPRAPLTTEQKKLIPIALAVGAFLLFGG